MKRYLIFLLLAGPESSAQQTLPAPDTTQQLKEVVIYQADNATPVTFLNVYATDLDTKSTGQEPSFLLAETPSVTVYSDAGNTQGYSYFRMRGIDQTRINMTLDGVPLNEPEDQGAYFSNYPDLFNSIDKIQIQQNIFNCAVGAISGSIVHRFCQYCFNKTISIVKRAV